MLGVNPQVIAKDIHLPPVNSSIELRNTRNQEIKIHWHIFLFEEHSTSHSASEATALGAETQEDAHIDLWSETWFFKGKSKYESYYMNQVCLELPLLSDDFALWLGNTIDVWQMSNMPINITGKLAKAHTFCPENLFLMHISLVDIYSSQQVSIWY